MGAFRLFKLFGVQVYVHWSWLVGALIMIPSRSLTGRVGGIGFNTALYLTLFAIVLLHEFGHALACRSVGGRAEHIVLWPLGGIAFVDPPPRPGPVLWSIVAGPLVNVVLLPLLWLAVLAANLYLEPMGYVALSSFIFWVAIMNSALLFFNLLPIYPLDGGQIVQALLWFLIGRAKSLMIVASLGLVAAVFGALWAFSVNLILLGLIAIFVGLQSLQGIQMARVLAEGEAAGVKM